MTTLYILSFMEDSNGTASASCNRCWPHRPHGPYIFCIIEQGRKRMPSRLHLSFNRNLFELPVNTKIEYIFIFTNRIFHYSFKNKTIFFENFSRSSIRFINHSRNTNNI